MFGVRCFGVMRCFIAIASEHFEIHFDWKRNSTTNHDHNDEEKKTKLNCVHCYMNEKYCSVQALGSRRPTFMQYDVLYLINNMNEMGKWRKSKIEHGEPHGIVKR